MRPWALTSTAPSPEIVAAEILGPPVPVPLEAVLDALVVEDVLEAVAAAGGVDLLAVELELPHAPMASVRTTTTGSEISLVNPAFP